MDNVEYWISELEKNKLYRCIERTEYKQIIYNCVKFVVGIWSGDKLIQYYTDHSIKHSLSILKKIEAIFQNAVDEVLLLSEDEIFILILGALLHDIGMQCDIREYSDIRELAESKYDAIFNEKYPKGELSKSQQSELRENHHLLTAAWLDVAYDNKTHDLCDVVKEIPFDMVGDIIDVCKFHSKLEISKCEEKLKYTSTLNKRFIAAILRLGDELDIDKERVTMRVVDNFYIPEENSIHWYLHNNTNVNIRYSHDEKRVVITMKISLRNNDFKNYGDFINTEYKGIIKKNIPILHEIKDRIATVFNENQDVCVSEDFAPEIPNSAIEKYIDSKKSLNEPCVDSQSFVESKLIVDSQRADIIVEQILSENLIVTQILDEHLKFLVNFSDDDLIEISIAKSEFILQKINDSNFNLAVEAIMKEEVWKEFLPKKTWGSKTIYDILKAGLEKRKWTGYAYVLDDEIIAYVDFLTKSGNNVEIGIAFTSKQHRRKGLVTSLIRLILLENYNCDFLTGTFEENQSMREALTKLGFHHKKNQDERNRINDTNTVYYSKSALLLPRISELGEWKPDLLFCPELRARELNDLNDLLKKHNIIFVTGEGGNGKTELVKYYCNKRLKCNPKFKKYYFVEFMGSLDLLGN